MSEFVNILKEMIIWYTMHEFRAINKFRATDSNKISGSYASMGKKRRGSVNRAILIIALKIKSNITHQNYEEKQRLKIN